MDLIVKLNAQTNGRDKLARLVQYASRIVWHQLETKNANKYTIDRLRNLEVAFSNFRKILRLGRFADLLYTSVDSLNIEDKFVKITVFLSKVATGLYFYADNIIWLSKSGFMKKTDSSQWGRTANKFWLLSIIMNILRDIYEIILLLDIKKNELFRPTFVLENTWRGCSVAQFKHLYLLVECHKDVFIDTLKNGCDLFIPLTALGYTKMSPSTVGLLGVISSITAIITMVKPFTKLTPG